jgi:hypothetical protein
MEMELLSNRKTVKPRYGPNGGMLLMLLCCKCSAFNSFNLDAMFDNNHFHEAIVC